MPLFHAGSRRQFQQERTTESFRQNLLSLTGTKEDTTAHVDTVNYLMECMPDEGLEDITWRLIRTLIRSKCLDKFRLDGDFLITIDGTHLFSFSQRHCPHCLKTQHTNGSVTYYHYVLEAKLVTNTGLAFSIASEFVENTDDTFDKQDCEKKAFYRLVKKIKQRFPRLPICLLLDALFADQYIFELCGQYRWSHITTFKEGSLPNIFNDAKQKCLRYPQNRLRLETEEATQNFTWAQNLNHKGHGLHAIFCEETKPQHKQNKTTQFAWITDLRPDHRNVAKIANQGGRCRWKTENEGFNTQKNGGYNLEHAYGLIDYAWKNYYFLIQIAHLLIQLITESDLFAKLQKETIEASKQKPKHQHPRPKENRLGLKPFFQSIKNFVKRLCESFRLSLFSEMALDPGFPARIQIRLKPP